MGKFAAALEFAEKIIVSETPASDVAHVVRTIHSLTHPHLTVVDQLWIEDVMEDWEALARSSNFPQVHRSKAPKAKSDAIGTDDLTEIIGRVALKRETHHVVVIRRIERMTIETANKFLKTLEEPPPHTIFILTTDSFADVLPTIVSRCRVVEFANVAPRAIDQLLRQHFPDLAPDLAARIMNLSLGKPARAVRLAKNPELFTAYTDYFRRLLGLFEKPDIGAKLAFAEEASKTRASVDFFLEATTYFLRSFLLSRAKKPESNSRYTTQKLVALTHALAETREQIERNVNARLAVEHFLLCI